METTRKMTKALLWGVLVLLFTFIPLSHAVAQTCVQPPSGLIGWWDADSVSGTTATDISGNGNDGTIVGGVSIVPGFVGNAFSFDGMSGTRISGVLSNFTAGNSPITIAAWFNQPTASAQPGRGIVGVGDVPPNQHFFQRLCTSCEPPSIWDGRDGQNRLFIGADDGGSDKWWGSNTVITQNEWNFGVTTWDPSTNEVRIYINGDPDRTQTLSTLSLTKSFFIGGDAYNDNFFNGLIDEIQIFNRVLTDTEILAEFLAGSAGKCTAGPFTDFAFSDFAATVGATLGPLASDDSFEVQGTFTLDAGSDGIDPLTQDVTLQVGAFSTTISAGFGLGEVFDGDIDGVALKVEISLLGANTFKFEATGEGADLTGTLIPVTVGLAVGNDGRTTVLETAEIIAQ